MKRRSFIRQIIWAGVAPGILLPRSVRASRSFNGTDQYFMVTSTPVTNYPFTFAAWVNPGADGALTMAMAINSSTTSRCVLYKTTANLAQVQAINSSGSNQSTSGTTTVPAGSWQQICGVCNSSTSRSIFTGGTDKQTGTTSIVLSGIDRIIIGARINAGSVGAFANGAVGDSVIYDRALSDDEVAQLYIGGPRVVRNGLVFWTRMTESGDLKDIVGGRTLTAFNAPPVSELHPRTR